MNIKKLYNKDSKEMIIASLLVIGGMLVRSPNDLESLIGIGVALIGFNILDNLFN